MKYQSLRKYQQSLCLFPDLDVEHLKTEVEVFDSLRLCTCLLHVVTENMALIFDYDNLNKCPDEIF